MFKKKNVHQSHQHRPQANPPPPATGPSLDSILRQPGQHFLLGLHVKKPFQGRDFSGIAMQHFPSEKCHHVFCDDGNDEDDDEHELEHFHFQAFVRLLLGVGCPRWTNSFAMSCNRWKSKDSAKPTMSAMSQKFHNHMALDNCSLNHASWVDVQTVESRPIRLAPKASTSNAVAKHWKITDMDECNKVGKPVSEESAKEDVRVRGLPPQLFWLGWHTDS